MKVEGKVAVVTGAASGIGRALARRFAREGARGVAVADVQAGPLRAVADEIGGLAVPCDATDERAVQALVAAAEERFGPIDVFCSNAGVANDGGEEAPDEEWRLNFDLHVMAHVYAARAVAPNMAARGSGYLVNTASAAGLLTHVGSATYAVTKHAAVALAEFLAIAYGDRGVRVSVLCPQAVRTAMTSGARGGGGEHRRDDRARGARGLRHRDDGPGGVPHPSPSPSARVHAAQDRGLRSLACGDAPSPTPVRGRIAPPAGGGPAGAPEAGKTGRFTRRFEHRS